VRESIKGARSHRFLLNKESAWPSPYLARQLSVFCQSTSEFIRVSRYSRKMMVASKDTRNYTSSGKALRPVSERVRVHVPRLNGLKFLQWGV